MKVCEPIFYSKEKANQILADAGLGHIKVKSDVNMISKPMDFCCEKHNYNWISTFYEVSNNKWGCRYCAIEGRRLTNLQKSNLWITRPDIASLLENPEDGYQYFENSKEHTWFLCPDCHSRLYKSIATVRANGLKCNICSDGFSYPNKLMSQILIQLNVTFITEYSPNWISPRRYDFYFCINNNQYIIEMDGGLGHGKRLYSTDTKTLQESLEIDYEKDNYAKKHGINVIRIDCTKSDIQYIKNNIINSELNQIFNLENIDWIKCDILSRQSNLLKVCQLYAKYPFLSYKEMCKIFNMCEDTIRKYIQIGSENGLCNSYKLAGGIHIICLDSSIIFRNISEAGRFYHIPTDKISQCCKGQRDQIHGLHFVFLDQYKGDINKLIPDYTIKANVENNKRPINMYDKNFIFIETYESVTEAANKNNLNLRQIIKSCKSNHNYNYGKTFYYADDINQPDKTRIIAA